MAFFVRAESNSPTHFTIVEYYGPPRNSYEHITQKENEWGGWRPV